MEQATYFDLTSMRNVDINIVDPDTLTDIRDIKINVAMPLLERARDYLIQIKNPYCFRSGKIVMKIKHSETDTTIEDCMERYFRSL